MANVPAPLSSGGGMSLESLAMGGDSFAEDSLVKELFKLTSWEELATKSDIPAGTIMALLRLMVIGEQMNSVVVKTICENYLRMRISVNRQGRQELVNIARGMASGDKGDDFPI